MTLPRQPAPALAAAGLPSPALALVGRPVWLTLDQTRIRATVCAAPDPDMITVLIDGDDPTGRQFDLLRWTVQPATVCRWHHPVPHDDHRPDWCDHCALTTTRDWPVTPIQGAMRAARTAATPRPDRPGNTLPRWTPETDTPTATASAVLFAAPAPGPAAPTGPVPTELTGDTL